MKVGRKGLRRDVERGCRRGSCEFGGGRFVDMGMKELYIMELVFGVYSKQGLVGVLALEEQGVQSRDEF